MSPLARFFETFEVVEEVGNWTKAPYPIDVLSRGLMTTVTDICDPADRSDPPDFEMGVMVHPFAVEGNLMVPTRCAPEEIRERVIDLMRDTTEMIVTKAMWSGVSDLGAGATLFLKHADITEVPRVADYAETLATVLEEAYEQTPSIKPVVHLGWQAAMALQFGLQNLKLPFVVPPGYPKNAIAVTGPVRIRMSPMNTTVSVDWSINRKHIEITRFAAIEFDPYQAVRAADSV